MKVFINVCHPEPQSFNHAMFHQAVSTLRAEGHEVKTTDIYAMEFDPLSSRKNFASIADKDYLRLPVEERNALKQNSFDPALEAEIAKMEWCDLMILQFPIWWFGFPAGLKGWIDRTFANGRIYGFGHMFSKGKMKGKKVLLSLTTGIPKDGYTKTGIAGAPLEILRPMHYGVFQFVGFDVLSPQIVYSPTHQDADQRSDELAIYAARLKSIFSEQGLPVEKV